VKRKLVITLLLLTLVAMPLFSACKAAITSTTTPATSPTPTTVAPSDTTSGSDFQYQMLLSGDTSGHKVLKQWTGRGDIVTEEFTVSSSPWEVYSSNTPDSSNW
jgi:hypothetical protein